MLEIRNLKAKINDVEILHGVDLTIKKGEIHAIMGTNGSGKSTLSKVLTGHPSYEITEGNVYFENKEVTSLSPEERAHAGLFLAFQYPVEVPGVSNEEFLRIAYNLKQKALNLPEVTPIEFFSILNQKLNTIGVKPDFLTRNVNEGFSGGEKREMKFYKWLF